MNFFTVGKFPSSETRDFRGRLRGAAAQQRQRGARQRPPPVAWQRPTLAGPRGGDGGSEGTPGKFEPQKILGEEPGIPRSRAERRKEPENSQEKRPLVIFSGWGIFFYFSRWGIFLLG